MCKMESDEKTPLARHGELIFLAVDADVNHHNEAILNSINNLDKEVEMKYDETDKTKNNSR